MIPLTAEEGGQALGVAPLGASVPGVSIDSRTIRPRDLFVALRGERFDGHDFVNAAFSAGASGAVVERKVASGKRDRLYVVNDTLEALGALGRAVRRKSRTLVFAVTGSVGKTSTKDLLGVMVGQVRQVTVTSGNQNNEVGVPLTLLAIQPETEAVIVEMGMRGYGQIAALARVAEPDIGIITNIYPVHLELLRTVEGIAQAKGELAHGLREGGTVVIPADCDVLQPYIAAAGCHVVTFGLDGEADSADIRGSLHAHEGGRGYTLRLVWPGGEVEVDSVYLPRHTVWNVTSAAAACYAAGLPVGECVIGVASVRSPGGRGDVIDAPGLRVIDDTYNASPAAMRAALDDLVRMAGESGGRPVAVLGDMLELGPEAERYHREVGAYAGAIGVRALWGVGAHSRSTVEGFESAWEREAADRSEWNKGHVGSAEETSLVVADLRQGDVVLFKGSRSIGMERMVSRVLDEARDGRWGTISGSLPGDEGQAKEKR